YATGWHGRKRFNPTATPQLYRTMNRPVGNAQRGSDGHHRHALPMQPHRLFASLMLCFARQPATIFFVHFIYMGIM
ncbi:MAG: hypothetical protein FWG81_11440, partial [Betaproteobacteria bacterium]|nr:hypothetical protein [Betaproteobacteria bacterium]